MASLIKVQRRSSCTLYWSQNDIHQPGRVSLKVYTPATNIQGCSPLKLRSTQKITFLDFWAKLLRIRSLHSSAICGESLDMGALWMKMLPNRSIMVRFLLLKTTDLAKWIHCYVTFLFIRLSVRGSPCKWPTVQRATIPHSKLLLFAYLLSVLN